MPGYGRCMLIRAYGKFWRRDEIDWTPGRGNHRAGFQLLGRRGTNLPGLQVADFRNQTGIYILYNDYGPYYVGLTRQSGIGKRLKDHTTDLHAGTWDRFTWFGFANVLQSRDERGLQIVKPLKVTVGTPNQAIADIEALLIHAMGPRNTNMMRFERADEWEQIKLDERDYFLEKVG